MTLLGRYNQTAAVGTALLLFLACFTTISACECRGCHQTDPDARCRCCVHGHFRIARHGRMPVTSHQGRPYQKLLRVLKPRRNLPSHGVIGRNESSVGDVGGEQN